MLKREKVNNSIEQNLAKDVKEIMSEEDLGEKIINYDVNY